MASLSSHSNELIACLEDMREKREQLHMSILRDEEEKARIQKELTILTERLSVLNTDLVKKISTRQEFDAAITETECELCRTALSQQSRKDRFPSPSLFRFCRSFRFCSVLCSRLHEDSRVLSDSPVSVEA